MNITLGLPGRDSAGRLSWIEREIRLVREGDGWRSADPVLAVSIRGPFAATVRCVSLRRQTVHHDHRVVHVRSPTRDAVRQRSSVGERSPILRS